MQFAIPTCWLWMIQSDAEGNSISICVSQYINIYVHVYMNIIIWIINKEFYVSLAGSLMNQLYLPNIETASLHREDSLMNWLPNPRQGGHFSHLEISIFCAKNMVKVGWWGSARHRPKPTVPLGGVQKHVPVVLENAVPQHGLHNGNASTKLSFISQRCFRLSIYTSIYEYMRTWHIIVFWSMAD